MNILFTSCNARFTHSSLAARYIRNALLEVMTNLDTYSMYEFTFSHKKLEVIENIVLAKPDVLLISLYIWNEAFFSSILEDIHALLPECKIVLGGPECSYNTGKWLNKFPFIQGVVIGPGEESIKKLYSTNFAFDETKTLQIPCPPFKDIKYPYIHSDYAELKHRYVYYESSRGCPFSCSYCLSSREDNCLSEKSSDLVCAELDMLIESNPVLIKFVDRTFNSNPKRAREIWTHLITNHFTCNTKFHFEIHPELLSEEDFILLETIPNEFFQFEIGIQSTNLPTLKAINRLIHWEKVKANILKLEKNKNLHVHLDLIVGLPFEGLTELEQSFNDVILLKPEHFQLGFLKGLYGTQMKEEASLYHMLFMSEAPYEILANKWLGVYELHVLRIVAELVDNIGNIHKNTETLEKLFLLFNSPFKAYYALAEYAQKTNYDVRTKHVLKNEEFLLAFLRSLSS